MSHQQTKGAGNVWEPTSAKCQTTDTDLSRDRGKNVPAETIATFTHPAHSPTENGDVEGLESLIHGIPDQAGPYHSGTGCRIVSHLAKPPSVDQDSSGRREPGIRAMTTALYLEVWGTESDVWP